MAKKELIYRIGDHVKVDMRNEAIPIYESRLNSRGTTQDYRKIIRAVEEFDKRTLSPMPKDIRKGVITGMKIFCEGWHYAAERFRSIPFGPDDDIDPGGIDVQQTLYLWCVRFGYVNKEHYFFEEDIERFLKSPKTVLTRPMYIPFKDTGWNSSMADRARKNMKEESKHWPRDSKGRFA